MNYFTFSLFTFLLLVSCSEQTDQQTETANPKEETLDHSPVAIDIRMYTDTVQGLVDNLTTFCERDKPDTTISNEKWHYCVIAHDLESVIIEKEVDQELFGERYVLIGGELIYVKQYGEVFPRTANASFWNFEYYYKKNELVYYISLGHAGISEAELKTGLELWKTRQEQFLAVKNKVLGDLSFDN